MCFAYFLETVIIKNNRYYYHSYEDNIRALGHILSYSDQEASARITQKSELETLVIFTTL
jgi:hypothetical protein